MSVLSNLRHEGGGTVLFRNINNNIIDNTVVYWSRWWDFWTL